MNSFDVFFIKGFTVPTYMVMKLRLIKFLKKKRNMLTLTADTSKTRQNAPTAFIFKPREKYICSKKKYLLIVIFLRLFKN